MALCVIQTVAELKNAVAEARESNKRVGLVPTMGALHEGHLSLVNKACDECEFVVVSVFVNPTQFNNAHDLSTYPRNLDADVALLANNTNADVVFAPSVEEMYPDVADRALQAEGDPWNIGQLGAVMEGSMRPGHFNGVCQVVTLLMSHVEPDKAYFGEKDFQQLAIIRKVVAEKQFGIDIVGCPIMRYADGLAISSRNALLSAEAREVAPKIHAVLEESKKYKYIMSPRELEKWVTDKLNEEPLFEVEYYSICDAITLQPLNNWSETDQVQGCITCYDGTKEDRVRLIDNIAY